MKRPVLVAAVVIVLGAAVYVGYRATRSDATTVTATSAGSGDTGSASQPSAASSAPAAAASAAAPTDASAPTATPSAEPALPPVRWLNIASAMLGGRVEHVSSTSKDRGWDADQLIDSGAADEACAPVCGWASDASPTFPQDIVLSFHQRREAALGRVVIDTLTNLTRTSSQYLPRQVEVWGSTTSATDGFGKIAEKELSPEPKEHAIGFTPVPVRFLRIRILSIHSGDRAIVGEVSAFEGATEPTIVADLPRNLALPAFGGGIVSFTSEYASYRASQLIDGSGSTDWRSMDAELPQQFVFGVGGAGGAHIDRMILTTRANLATAPKLVSVAVSSTSPTDGFEEVGRVTLKQVAQDQAIPIGRHSRFVKLRILENFSGPIYTSLGEVQLLEGQPAGYEPVLTRASLSSVPNRAAERRSESTAAEETGATPEREPNNDPSQAPRLQFGTSIAGRIEPIGESDYLQLSVPGPDRSVLTLDLHGRPYVRTSVSLLDRAGKPTRRFDPSRAVSEKTTFSWLVDPGDYAIHVTEPLASVVLVWDTSGSMERDVAAIQHAVHTYLDQVLPTERVSLIRFSSSGFKLSRPDVEVLLPEFTSDRGRLKKATNGKFDADGGTPFYDAVAKAMNLLDGVQGNRVIVVMTDGEDAGSQMNRQQFWDLIVAKGIRVYTVALGDITRYSMKLGTTPQRFLEDMATATHGRAFYTKNSAELATFYQEISNELRTPASYRLRVTRAQATGTLEVRATGERLASVAAPSQIELIVDASGSMKRLAGKRTMIDTAKDVLVDLVQSLPPEVHVALRVYGHRVREGVTGACEDSELVFPFAKLDKPRLIGRIRGIQALGTTPIAHSLSQIARDFGQSGGEKLVVLVTDGKEECGGDPMAAVAALQKQGIKVRLNIVGFGLADPALKAELQKLAEMTSGQFVAAQEAASLRAAIERSLAVPFDVLDAAGAKVAEGMTGQGTIELPEGVYTVRVRTEKPIDVSTVRIVAREATRVELRKEGREIGVAVLPRR